MMEHDSLYKGIDAVIHLAALPSPAVAVCLSCLLSSNRT